MRYSVPTHHLPRILPHPFLRYVDRITDALLYSFLFLARDATNRAYKLGKKKRSYNQVELTFDRASPGTCGINEEEDGDDDDVLNIYEATERSFSIDVPEDMRDSALEYELKLYNGATVRALIYLVYAQPLGKSAGKKATDGNATAASGATAGRATTTNVVAGFASDGSGHLVDRAGHTWLPVTRGRCAKGCTGPILSAIQRFGKQGRTQKGAAAKEDKDTAAKEATAAAGAQADGDKWKDARNLFISIDEASNHVCAFGPAKCKIFR